MDSYGLAGRLSSTTTILYISILPGIVLVVCYNILFKRVSFDRKAPSLISTNYPILGAIEFFTKRGQFFQREGAKSKHGAFSFYIGREPVVGITGDTGRAPFFESSKLSLAEGQGFMFGAGPSVSDGNAENTTGTQEFTDHFSKRLITILKRERLLRGLPMNISDVKTRLKTLADSPSGVTDPFETIFKIVFQLTMRTVGCDEIATDADWCDKLLEKFNIVEESFGAADVIAPWLPTIAKIRRTFAGGSLYMAFKKIVDKRKKTGEKKDDPLQYLIDNGDDMTKIIAFELSALFAGQLNSGHNAAYSAYYFARHPEWQARAREEVIRVAKEHTTADPSASLEEQLTSLPFDTWESEFKVLDKCLRECIRLQLMGSAIRKNISDKPVSIGEEVIQPGAFSVYQFADPHYNASIYASPTTFDPSRFDPPRAEDKKQPHAYIGWGSGRHPCLGMRFAKLEYYVIIAFLLAYYDLEACDAKGVKLRDDAPFPEVDKDGLASTPPKDKIWIRCKPRS